MGAKRNPAGGEPAGLLGDERRPDQRTRSGANYTDAPGNRLDTGPEATGERDGFPRFALLPVVLIRHAPFPNGWFKALALIAGMAALSHPASSEEPLLAFDRIFNSPPGGWGAALGCANRTARLWRGSLLSADVLERDETGQIFVKFGSDPLWADRICKLPLAFLPDLSPGEFRLWAILWSFRDRRGFAWPSQATLAECCGVDDRTIRNRFAKLEGQGFIRRQNRRRGSTVYHLQEGGMRFPVKRHEVSGQAARGFQSKRHEISAKIEEIVGKKRMNSESEVIPREREITARPFLPSSNRRLEDQNGLEPTLCEGERRRQIERTAEELRGYDGTNSPTERFLRAKLERLQQEAS